MTDNRVHHLWPGSFVLKHEPSFRNHHIILQLQSVRIVELSPVLLPLSDAELSLNCLQSLVITDVYNNVTYLLPANQTTNNISFIGFKIMVYFPALCIHIVNYIQYMGISVKNNSVTIMKENIQDMEFYIHNENFYQRFYIRQTFQVYKIRAALTQSNLFPLHNIQMEISSDALFNGNIQKGVLLQLTQTFTLPNYHRHKSTTRYIYSLNTTKDYLHISAIKIEYLEIELLNPQYQPFNTGHFFLELHIGLNLRRAPMHFHSFIHHCLY